MGGREACSASSLLEPPAQSSLAHSGALRLLSELRKCEMGALEIGQRLVALCQEGKNLEAIDELYGSNIVSVEAVAPPEGEREATGIDAVCGKSEWWVENHEVHSASVKGLFPHGDDRFCVIFEFDATHKPSGQRTQMEEIGLFSVSDGKISREEFFYVS